MNLKEHAKFAFKVLIALFLIGIVCDILLSFLGFNVRKFVFSPLMALGLVKAPAASSSATPNNAAQTS